MGSTPSTRKSSTKDEIESELLQAIKTGDTKLLEKIKSTPELSKLYQKAFPSSLLHYAAIHGQQEWLEFLLDKKLDVNGLTEGKETPLHSCIRAKRHGLSCAKMLLRAKADINAKNVWGRTPLMEAIVQFKYDIAEYLLSEGANVNLSDSNRTSPLHVCASYGKLDYLKALLAKGANQNTQDERGRTSLHFAINGNHTDIVKYLIENGCNVNLYDSNFGSPLQKALTMANLNMMLCLLKAGASTSLFTTSRLTSLRLSLSELALHMVQVSLETCSEEEDFTKDTLYGPPAKALRHIQCFRLLLIAHGQPIQKNVKDKLKHIIVKCKVQVLKNELLVIQMIANAMSAQMLKKAPVDSLQNLARFSCRKYLMVSRRNFIWACDQMDVPSVLTNILTFKI